jgi:hypothetical protein
MSISLSRGLLFVLVTGGLSLAGACAANAAETDGTGSIAGGNQVLPAISAPVTVDGNALALLGDATSGGSSAATTGSATAAPAQPSTDGSHSIAGGNQVAPDIAAPVTLGGNAVSVLGDATAARGSSAPATTGAGTPSAAAPVAGAGQDSTTDGSRSVAGGNQIAPEVAVPVTVGGNAVSVFGDATAARGTTAAGTGTAAPVGVGQGATTDGANSVAGGNQLLPGLFAPITLGGDAVSVLGSAATAGTTAGSGSTTGQAPTWGGGALGGELVPTVPVQVGGTASTNAPGGEYVPMVPAQVDGTAASTEGSSDDPACAGPVFAVSAGAGSSAPERGSTWTHDSGEPGDQCTAAIDLASAATPIPSDSTAGAVPLALSAVLALAGGALALRKRMS